MEGGEKNDIPRQWHLSLIKPYSTRTEILSCAGLCTTSKITFIFIFIFRLISSHFISAENPYSCCPAATAAAHRHLHPRRPPVRGSSATAQRGFRGLWCCQDCSQHRQSNDLRSDGGSKPGCSACDGLSPHWRRGRPTL